MTEPTTEQIEELAKQLRAKALSGYAWSVPKTWEEVHEQARNAWREKARDQLRGVPQ